MTDSELSKTHKEKALRRPHVCRPASVVSFIGRILYTKYGVISSTDSLWMVMLRWQQFSQSDWRLVVLISLFQNSSIGHTRL